MKKGSKQKPQDVDTNSVESPDLMVVSLQNLVDFANESLSIGTHMTELIIDSYEKEIQSKELNKIRLPFATKHILENSMFSVNNSMLGREFRYDDEFISQQYQDKCDQEPMPVSKDFHVPKNSKVAVKINHKISSAATPTEFSYQTRSGSQKSSRMQVGLSKRTSGSNVLKSQNKKRRSNVKLEVSEKKANVKDLSENKQNELALSDLSVSKDLSLSIKKRSKQDSPNIPSPSPSTIKPSSKQNQKKNAIKKKNLDLAEQIRLDQALHYEDAEQDEDLRNLVPYLRRVTLQREADERKTEEAKKQARQRREMLEKQNRALLNGKAEVADMGITFDDQGQPIRVKKLDPQFFSNNTDSKNIIDPIVREDLTEVVHSDLAQVVRNIRAAKRQQNLDDFDMPTPSEHETEDLELNLDTGSIGTPKKNDTGGESKSKMLIAKQTLSNFAAAALTVGEVKPTYGVRMKSQLKGEKTSVALTKSSRHDTSPEQNIDNFVIDIDQELTINNQTQLLTKNPSLEQENLSLPLHQLGGVATGEKTFRSRYSKMSLVQAREYEEWGQSKDGYIAGGNFDEDPTLEVYTLKKYHDMKNRGELSKITNLEDNKESQKNLLNNLDSDSKSQSQMLQHNEYNDIFRGNSKVLKSEMYTDERIKGLAGMVGRVRNTGQKGTYLTNRSMASSALGANPHQRSVFSSVQQPQYDNVSVEIQMQEASEMLILKPDDTFYPKAANFKKAFGKKGSRYQDDSITKVKKGNQTILPQITSQKKGSSIYNMKNDIEEDAYNLNQTANRLSPKSYSKKQYGTGGYHSKSVQGMYPEGTITRRGESSQYAETRINIDQIKQEMKNNSIQMSLIERRPEGPRIPNRLASLQKTMNQQSSLANTVGENEVVSKLAHERFTKMKMVGGTAATSKNSYQSILNPKLMNSRGGSQMSIPIQHKQGSLGGYFGSFGYGNRDEIKIHKGTSAFAIATQGQIKSHKQNQIAMKQNLKFINSQIKI